jgi:hypothetical protein
MAKLRLIILLGLTASTMLWGRPSFSETTISEQTLTGDIIVKDLFQPGSGLPVGKIHSVQGEAFVFHRDPTVGYRIKTGLPLYVGDIMHTRGAARIICRLIDGSKIVLIAETSLTIIQSSYNSSRKTGVSFLYLKRGGARFKLHPQPDLTSYDFKVQTDLAFAQAREADFVVRAETETTDVITFENSRLEVTGMAQPEEITYLSGYQRTVVSNEIITPTVENPPREDIDSLITNFHSAPQSILIALETKSDREGNPTEESPAENDRSADEQRPVVEETLVEEDLPEPKTSE